MDTIQTGFTIFSIPFWFENDHYDQKCSLWEMENSALSTEGDAGDILYSHIMNFLQGQVRDMEASHSDYLKVLRLSNNPESERNKLFWRHITRKCEASIKGHPQIPFYVVDVPTEGILNPHLYIYHSAKIGVLTFCVRLIDYSIEHHKLLNYYLHKIDEFGEDFTCKCPSLQMNSKMDLKTEEERQAKEQEIIQGRKYVPGSDNEDPYSPFTFHVRQIIDMWLTDFSGIHLFSDRRAQVFSYSLFDGTKEGAVNEAQIRLEAHRLSRCVNDKYLIHEDDRVLNTFDNIYVSSALEGTAIIGVSKAENKSFMKNFKATVRDRYLWIYLLAIIQGTTQQKIIRDLSRNEKMIDDVQLSRYFNLIQKVRMNCYFTDISPFTQHNQFYNFVCQSMHIDERFKEIDSKMQILDQTIRKRHDDESESKQRALSVLVGVLTLFQVGEAIFTVSNGDPWDRYLPSIIGFVFFAAIIAFIFRKDIKDICIHLRKRD